MLRCAAQQPALALVSPKPSLTIKEVIPGHTTLTELEKKKKNPPACLMLSTSVKMPEFNSPPPWAGERRGERIYYSWSRRFTGIKFKFHFNSSFFVTTNSP